MILTIDYTKQEAIIVHVFFQHGLILPVFGWHINGIMQHIPFLSSFFKMEVLWDIHVVTSSIFLFLFMTSILIYEYITICLFIFLLINIGTLSYLKLLWIKLLWVFLYKYHCGHMSSFLCGNTECGIPESLDWYVEVNLIRNWQSGFLSCTSFHSY